MLQKQKNLYKLHYLFRCLTFILSEESVVYEMEVTCHNKDVVGINFVTNRLKYLKRILLGLSESLLEIKYIRDLIYRTMSDE